ncbi:MAG: helix-turn-helix transcriptional regulator [Myxococcota bacterium]
MSERLTRKERRIVELLETLGESTGWALVDASGGDLKRGTVYVTLGRMADKGLVESTQEARRPGQSGPLRRLYRPTARATALLALERQAAALLGELA